MCKTVVRKPTSVFAVFAVFSGVVFLFSSCVARSRETASRPQTDCIAECLSFLAANGWKTEDAPCEIAEVRIPERFDAVYGVYNELQRSQGFDLAPYRGKYAQKFVFRLTEYPGAKDADGIRATLFVCGGKIIGGDIGSTALDGFMHGIIPEGSHNGYDKTR